MMMSALTSTLLGRRQAGTWSGARAPVFGIAGRRALLLYLRVTSLVMLMFLIIAFAIDLAQNLDDVLARAEVLEMGKGGILARYLLYRAVDIVTRLFPVACFIGLFASELYRLFNRETTVLAGAGWSPAQTLAVVAVFGCLTGALQFSLERWWRPAAVFAQAELELGGYGARFARGVVGEKRWFVLSGNALRATVLRDGAPELRGVELYRGVVSGDLRDVLVARRAVPTGHENFWRFYDVDLWASLPQQGGEGAARSQGYARKSLYLMTRYDSIDIRLDLFPETLEFYDVPAFYLPQAPLERLAEAGNPLKTPDVDAALWRRWAALFLPGAYALLGASLAPIAGSGRIIAPTRIVALALCGYLALVATKVSWAMGEIGSLSGFTSSWLAIVLALGGTLAAQRVLSRPH
ncbi:LptF/LptG family permease [Stappia taiwanensis]|uniref:LptF/LptG family permease n=1 Tax=Stappia taiwanensis TaxID=992267 RepID=A0A838XPU2_9HYPH|nr:LptF/LptG family permease [Stappia taiwanensis]MBA4612495.1 LptF/LptG family permease [Stappia taiwanensis]